jgi:hypothetical protein
MIAQAKRRPRRGRPAVGSLVGGPIFDFYAMHKRIATTTMLKDENDMGGKYGSWGPRKNSFRGVFDTGRWRAYIGLSQLEYEAFEKSWALYRKGHDPAIRIDVLDKILTNLGRPELFAQWYGEEAFRGEECEEEEVDLVA